MKLLGAIQCCVRTPGLVLVELQRPRCIEQHPGKTLLQGVLGLAEMELIFPTAALVVLCSVLVARTVLITHSVLATAEAVLP